MDLRLSRKRFLIKAVGIFLLLPILAFILFVLIFSYGFSEIAVTVPGFNLLLDENSFFASLFTPLGITAAIAGIFAFVMIVVMIKAGLETDNKKEKKEKKVKKVKLPVMDDMQNAQVDFASLDSDDVKMIVLSLPNNDYYDNNLSAQSQPSADDVIPFTVDASNIYMGDYGNTMLL